MILAIKTNDSECNTKMFVFFLRHCDLHMSAAHTSQANATAAEDTRYYAAIFIGLIADACVAIFYDSAC